MALWHFDPFDSDLYVFWCRVVRPAVSRRQLKAQALFGGGNKEVRVLAVRMDYRLGPGDSTAAACYCCMDAFCGACIDPLPGQALGASVEWLYLKVAGTVKAGTRSQFHTVPASPLDQVAFLWCPCELPSQACLVHTRSQADLTL